MDIQNGKHCADHGRDLHPLVDHMTKLQNFTKEENRAFFSISIFTSVNARTSIN